MGEYISGDANDLYEGFFTGNMVTPLNKAIRLPNGSKIRTESIVTDIKKAKDKKGGIYARCVIADINGNNAPLTIWSQQWNKLKKHFDEGRPIRAVCKVNVWEGGTGLVLERLEKSAGV